MVQRDSVALDDDVGVGSVLAVSVCALGDDKVRSIGQDQVASKAFGEVPEEDAGVVVEAVGNFVLHDVSFELVRQFIVSVAVSQSEAVLFVNQEEWNFIAVVDTG